MAIGTPVQIGAAADTTSASWSITTTGAVSAGETVVLLLSWIQDTSAGTVSASGGGLTWKSKSQLNEDPGAVAYCTAVLTAYAPSGMASSTAITVTMTGGGSTFGCGMTVLRVSGLGDPTVEDSDFDYADPGSTADWWGGAGARNIDTTGDALLLAIAMGDGTVTTSVTDSPATELSDFQDGTNSWTHTTAYRKETSNGSYTIDGNFATGQGFGTATALVGLKFSTPPAFPQVVGFNGGQNTANVNGNRAATIPTVTGGILADDLMLSFVAMDGNPSITFPDSGWNSLKNEAGNGSAVRVACAYKRCTGGESGTYNINTDASEGGGWQTYVIRGAHTTTVPEVSTGANGSAANSGNPDALDPTNWATEDTLWFAAMGNDGNVAVTAGPTDYTTGFANNRWANTAGAGIATGRRENASSSENPGTFTHGAEDNRAWTVAIRPAGASTLTRSAAISATAAITAAPQRDIQRSSAISATAALTASAYHRDLVRSSSIAATATIESAAVSFSVFERSASISATAAIATDYERDLVRQSSISATADISSSAEIEEGVAVLERSVSISATAAIEAKPQRDVIRSASIAATASIESAQRRDLPRSASIAATASISSEQERDLVRSATIAATASIDTIAEILGSIQRSASIDAAASMTVANRVVVHVRSASLSATASIDSDAAPVKSRSASISATASIASSAVKVSVFNRSASLSATAAMESAVRRDVVRSAAISAVAALDTTTERDVHRSAALSATALIAAAARIVLDEWDDDSDIGWDSESDDRWNGENGSRWPVLAGATWNQDTDGNW